MGCLFCELPADKYIYEDESFYAIYDLNPVTKGHALIMPKMHVSSLFDLPAEQWPALKKALVEVKKIVDEQHRPDGYNVGVNIGESAGQTIFHLHVHLMPRYSGDMDNPTGGVRGIIPDLSDYTS